MIPTCARWPPPTKPSGASWRPSRGTGHGTRRSRWSWPTTARRSRSMVRSATGPYCYDTTLRVPLILRRPGGTRAGERSDRIASVADVAPTLAEVLALPPLALDLDGRSLLREVPPKRGVYFESFYGYLAYGWSPLTGWVDAEGKYLNSSQPQFFDVANDADEEHDLFAGDRPRFEAYRERIRDVASKRRFSAAGDEVDAEARRNMAGLGYAAFAEPEGGLPGPFETDGLPSPASRVDEQSLSMSAQAHMNAGQWEEARALHAAILRENPRNLHSLEGIGACLINSRAQRGSVGAPAPRARHRPRERRGRARPLHRLDQPGAQRRGRGRVRARPGDEPQERRRSADLHPHAPKQRSGGGGPPVQESASAP